MSRVKGTDVFSFEHKLFYDQSSLGVDFSNTTVTMLFKTTRSPIRSGRMAVNNGIK